MSLAPSYHESLPYIDSQPSSPSLKAANLLIQNELSSLPPPPPNPPSSMLDQPSRFTETIQTELDRIANKQSLLPLDLFRYEAQDELPPPSTSQEQLLEMLSKSYTSSTYLASRLQNLELLEQYGKNAWLVGNYHLEEELKSLERELAQMKREIDLVNLERSRKQEEVRGEMNSLEEGWKRGVGKVLETEVAVEELRRELREEMRRQGKGEIS